MNIKPLSTMLLEKYLEGCKDNPSMYASASERMLKAIGEPVLVDTSKDERLGRIFHNKTIRTYPTFSDFYGMEETIEKIVNFFRFAAQGLEERKQILYLLGPVGGGKSSLAEKLKYLMQKETFYTIKIGNEISPIFESPLGLYSTDEEINEISKKYNIPARRFTKVMSPWAVKRLDEIDNDFSKIEVVEIKPSILKQIGISKVEPGDENNQDISTIVGKVNIRKLEMFDQDDPDAYSFAGGLNRATQGVLEFVEMFKAPIKMLHPLLTATQEGNYAGTEQIGNIPFNGIILAHSNEAEWQSFKNNRNNEAFIDRVFLIKVPYCLRYEEEEQVYRKLLSLSELSNAPCAPATLNMLAKFSVLTRLKIHENSNLYSKMKVYNGESLKDTDPNAKSHQEYTETAGVEEGMHGSSTRTAYKILSKTFNFDPNEVAADPVHLMVVLEKTIKEEQLPEKVEKDYLEFIKGVLTPKYVEFIGDEIQKAYVESYSDYGQNLFERYIDFADAWLEDKDHKDPDTGQLMDRDMLNAELSKLEKAAGINAVKDFRFDVVKFVMRYRAKHQGDNPRWDSYEKIRDAIQKRMFAQIEDLLPVISFESKKDGETEKKHHDFVERMMKHGYTEIQVKRLVEWYMRVKKAS
jgi:serine protein kinase